MEGEDNFNKPNLFGPSKENLQRMKRMALESAERGDLKNAVMIMASEFNKDETVHPDAKKQFWKWHGFCLMTQI